MMMTDRKPVQAERWVGETVHVVDDDRAVLRSSKALLESVGLRPRTYESPELFLSRITPDMTGCVVFDVRMPGMSGIELFDEAKRRGMELPVLFITGYGEIPSAVEAIRLGAIDFLEKPVDHRALLCKIYGALEVGDELARRRRLRRRVERRVARLTPRETEVLDLVVAGGTSRSIGESLGISQKTVEIHRSKIIEKMQVKNSVDLVRVIVESGLHPQDPV